MMLQSRMMVLEGRRARFVFARFGTYSRDSPPCGYLVFGELIMDRRTVEALARAGEYDKPLFRKAVGMFEVCVDSTVVIRRRE